MLSTYLNTGTENNGVGILPVRSLDERSLRKRDNTVSLGEKCNNIIQHYIIASIHGGHKIFMTVQSSFNISSESGLHPFEWFPLITLI